MSQNPINLGLRFLLELAAWAAMAYWGWTQHTGLVRWLLAIGLPLVAMTVWGVFRVPTESGKGVVAVPGFVRLIIEMVEFGGAVVLLFAAGRSSLAAIFGGLLLLHYAASYDYVIRLIGGPKQGMASDTPPGG
jgi:hypothetical protein